MAFDPALYDDFQPLGKPKAEERGEISKGLERGVRSIGQGFAGTAATAASALGADGLEEKALGSYMRQQDKMEQVAPNVTSVTDIRSIGEASDWIASTVAEQVPQLATMFTGAGVGVAVGKKVAKDRVRDQVESLVSGGMPVGEAAKKVADGVVKKYGTIGGAVAGAPINTGLIAGQMAQETGMIDSSAVLTGGALVSLVDQLPITKLMGGKTLDAGQGFADTLKEAAKSANKQGMFESGTEAFQTVIEQSTIDYVSNNLGEFSEEDISELINAAAAGYLIGGVLDGAGSAKGLAKSARDQSQPEQPGQTDTPDPAAEAGVPPPIPDATQAVDPLGNPINPQAAENQLAVSGQRQEGVIDGQYDEFAAEPVSEPLPQDQIPETRDPALTGEFIPADHPEFEQLSKILDDIDGEVITPKLQGPQKELPSTLRGELGNAAPQQDIPDPDVMKEVATQVNSNPTEGQKAAGNYAKGHVKLLGFDASIENPKGSERSGVNGAGKKWTSIMQSHYGDLKGTTGADGDNLDVFIGDDTEAPEVYVVDQIDPETGEFDEHKVMIGFPDEESAKQGYLANYDKGWQGLNNITPFEKEAFKQWAKDSDATTRPAASTDRVSDAGSTAANRTTVDTEESGGDGNSSPAIREGNDSARATSDTGADSTPESTDDTSLATDGPAQENTQSETQEAQQAEPETTGQTEETGVDSSREADSREIDPDDYAEVQKLINKLSATDTKRAIRDLAKLPTANTDEIKAAVKTLEAKYRGKKRGFLDVRREYESHNLPPLTGPNQRQRMLDAIDDHEESQVIRDVDDSMPSDDLIAAVVDRQESEKAIEPDPAIKAQAKLRTIESLANWAVKYAPDERYKTIATAIAKKAKGTEGGLVQLPQTSDNAGRYARVTDAVTGKFESEFITLRIAPGASGFDYHQALHELTHFLLKQEIDTDSDFKNQIERVRDIAIRHHQVSGSKKDWYGLQNAHEFTSEAMSNPEFQKYLAKIPDKNRSGIKLLDSFALMVRKVLGLDGDVTALDSINQIINTKAGISVKPEPTSKDIETAAAESDEAIAAAIAEKTTNNEAETEKNAAESQNDAGDSRQFDLPKDNREIRKQIAEREGIPAADVTNEQIKDEQEAIELQIVKLAREVIEAGREAGKSEPEIYSDLVELYNQQPNLNMRSGDSMLRQAYSTPAPLAYAAAVNAGFNPSVDTKDNSAGNGMLLAFVDVDAANANELDADRHNNLQDQGIFSTNKNALEGSDDIVFDQVIVNPPFGKIPGMPDGFETSDGTIMKNIDHAIAARALRSMDDDGKAVLIIGAGKQTGMANHRDMEFFKWMYQRYNVVRHHEIDGKLYRRQGAAWPIRIITVDGKRPEVDETILGPNYDTIERYTSWEQIGNELVNPEGIANRPEPGSIVEYIDGEAAANADRLLGLSDAENSGSDGKGGSGSKRPTKSVSGSGGSTSGRSTSGSSSDGKSNDSAVKQSDGVGTRKSGDSDGGRKPGQSTRPDNVSPSAGVDGRVEDPPKPKPKKKQKPASKFTAEDIQRTYDSQSTGMDLGALIPANMQAAAAKFQSKIVSEVGDIDQFVAKELDYKSVEEMQRGLAGLQIDGVAAQIYNSQRGKAIIVADQTGMGKGRQAAAVIRYALKQGKVPIFITEKANLLTDMYDDLQDIGMQADEIRPFLLNASAEISRVDPDTEEKTVIVPSAKSAKQKAFMNGVIESGAMPDGVNMIFTNYSQLRTDNIQRKAVKALAGKAYFVLDEAHNMAGSPTSGTGKKAKTSGAGFIQAATKGQPTMYLSATYAKRSDNMLAFNNTLLGSIGLEAEGPKDGKESQANNQKLTEALSKGGAPFLASIAHLMTSQGQLIRRERSFEGIAVNAVVDTSNKDRDLRIDDQLSIGFRAIYNADRAFHDIAVKQLKESMKGAAGVRGAGNRASVNHVGFNAVLHNYIGQLLIAKKADAVADQAIAAVERGEKPVIGLYNTMESFVENLGGVAGQPFNATFNDILQLALDRTRRISIKKGDKSTPVDIPLTELDPVTLGLYEAAMAQIEQLDLSGIPISPIDHIKHRMSQAGIEVGEITGRNMIVDYSGKEPVISQRTAAEKNGRRATIDKFNNNNIDAMLINAAGSTGLSIHASRAFLPEDQSKRRHMIIAQPPPDINTMMQMLGRINRTNQYDGDLKPTYTMLASASPSEKRQTASTLKKMSSLNANTSANTKGSMSFDAVDFLNYYGDIVVAEFFRDNPEFAKKIPGASLEYAKTDEVIQNPPEADFANKMTGRVNAFANAADAEFFYQEVSNRYKERVEYEDKMGTNRLSTKLVDLDAEILASTIVDEGDRSNSVVSGATVAHLVDAKAQGKYLKPTEVAEMVDAELTGRTSDEYASQFVSSALTEKQREEVAANRLKLKEESEKIFGRPILNNQSIDQFKPQDKPHAKKIEAFKKKLSSFYGSRPFRIQQNTESMEKTINAWAPGTTVQMEEQQEMKGVVVKYTTAKGSTFAPSSVMAHIATNSQAGVLKVPVSKLPQIYARSDFAVEEEYRTDASRREQRIIYTGNLVNPINDFKGQIVNFSDKKGKEHVGYLLPFWADSDIDVVSQSEFAMKNVDGLLAVLAKEKELKSSAGASLHYVGSQNIELRFPKSNMSREVSSMRKRWTSHKTAGADFYSKPGQNYYSAVARTPQQIQGILELAKDAQVYFQTSEDSRDTYVAAGGPKRATPAPSFDVSIKNQRGKATITEAGDPPKLNKADQAQWSQNIDGLPKQEDAQAIVNEWMQQHNVLERIRVISIDDLKKSAEFNDSLSNHVNAVLDGSRGSYEPTLRVIAIDQSFISELETDPASAVQTLAHEFGHAIMETEYAKAPLDVKAAIDADYQAYLDGVKGMSPDDMIKARRPDEVAGNANSSGDADYDLSFEEWFADVVGNALLRDLPSKFKSKKFFKTLARKLRQLMQSVKKQFETSAGVDVLLKGMTSKVAEQAAKTQTSEPQSPDDTVTPLGPLPKEDTTAEAAADETISEQPENLGEPIEDEPDTPVNEVPEPSPDLDVDPVPGADPVFKSSNPKLQKAVNFALDRGDQFKSWLNGTLNRRQLVEGYKHIFPRMKEYLSQSEEMDATRATWQTAGGEIGSRWRDLGSKNKDEADELASIIHTATIIGADPENFVDYSVDFLKAQRKAVLAKTKAKVARTRIFKEVDAATLRNIDQRIKEIPERRAQAKILIERFNNLSPEARQLYIDSRNFHKQMFNANTSALMSQIDGQEISGASKAAAKEAISQMRDDMKIAAPYFPLNRFGKYAVSASKDDETVYRHFESRNEAMQWRKEMDDQKYSTSLSKLSEVQSREDSIPPQFVSSIMEVIDEMGGDKGESPLADLKDQIQQMYLAALPELSARKHEIHRKKVQGFSEDAQRSFAHTAFHGSARLARQRHGWQIKQSLDKMKIEYKIARHPGTRKRYVEAAKQLEAVINAELDPGILLRQVEADAVSAKSESDREFWNGMVRQLKSDIDIPDLLDDYKQLIHNSKFINSDWHKVVASKPNTKTQTKTFKTKALADEYRVEMEGKGYLTSRQRLGDKYAGIGQEALDSLTKSYDWSMNPSSSPVVNVANSIAFVFQLGLTPAAALVNMTQVVLVSIPMLGGRHGMKASSDEIFKAAHTFTKGGTGRLTKLIDAAMKGKPITEDDIVSVRGNISKDENRMIDELTRKGTLDRTMAMDLASLAEDGITNSTYIYKALKVASFLFHHAERMNRETTALAAYRLEKAKLLKDGESPEQAHHAATDYASKMTWDSQFDYGSTNRAEYMRKDWQRLFFQYKQYSLSLAYLYTNTFKKAFLNSYQPVGMTAQESAQQVREAKKMFLGMAGMQFAFTGMLGMPLARVVGMTIESMVRALTDDDDFDYEHELRGVVYRALAPALGETMAQKTGLALTKGIADGFTPVSLHGRLSASELFFREPDARDEKGEEKFTHYTMQALGPSIGLLKSMTMAVNDGLMEGFSWRGMEQAMPKVLKDTIRAKRYWEEGATTKNGDQIVDLNALQVVLNWTGFQPSELAEAYARNSAVYDRDTRHSRKKSALRKRLNKAREAAGEDKYQTDKSYTKALEEIEKYNTQVPEVMQINEKSRKTSWRMYNRRKDKTVNGVYLSTRQKQAISDGVEF